MKMLILFLLTVVIPPMGIAQNNPDARDMRHPAILYEEYIFALEDAFTPEVHASTVAVSDNMVVASWFGGTKEKNKDVRI